MKFYTLRRLGLGDFQHVRTGLLGISCLDPTNILEQLTAAYRLGDKLGLMTRPHVNFDLLSEEVKTQVMTLYYSHLQHQLEPWTGLDERKLCGYMLGCDLIIQTETTTPAVTVNEDEELVEDIYEGLLAAWNSTGGRPLQGNFARLSATELLRDPKFAPFIAVPA